jgi:hypothetical protein
MNMKQLSIRIGIVLMLISYDIHGQNVPKLDNAPDTTALSESSSSSYEEVNIPKLVPVSPNAASLGVFGAIPVGHYTGVPSISIPIYEIELDGKKFPVNIGYHASGIKVAQEASIVGLGWALNAGGCITKEVRGWDDFQTIPLGYYFDTTFPQADANNNVDPSTANEDHWKYKMYTDNQSDPEPDLFHFNFASFSGTLFFNKYTASGNSFSTAKTIIRKESDYLDVTFHFSTSTNSSSWIIADGDGFNYYFNTHETSEMFTRSESNFNSTPPNRNYFTTRPVQSNTVTAWYLDSIVSPNNHKISFSYGKDRLYSPMFVSEDVSYQIAFNDSIIKGGGVPYSPPLDGAYKYYNYFFSKNEQVRLDQIAFNNGNLTFGYSDRLDIESAYADRKVKKLNTIAVANKREIVKNITFKHSYLGNTSHPLECRLMLDTLQIGTDGNTQNYVFSYNRNELPNKQSASSDYWGYYNLSGFPPKGNNFYFSPSMETNVNDEIQFFQGRNKTATESYIRNGILTAIQYPTGGKTVFDYEIHDFQNYFEAYNPYKQEVASIFYDTQEQPKYVSEDFDIPEETNLYLDLTSYLCNPMLNGASENIAVYIEKKQNTNTYITEKIYYLTMNIPDERRFVKMLAAGTYRIRMDEITTNSNTCIQVVAGKTMLEPINKGGGLRIKTMTDYSNNNNYTKRNFTYRRNGKSTGLLMTPPKHHIYYVLGGDYRAYLKDPFSGAVVGGGGINVIFWVLYLNGLSSPYTPFGNSATGGTVGYSYVEEQITDSNANGLIAYTFVNREDSLIDVSDRVLKNYPAIPHLNNGSPLEICYYNQEMKLQKKEKFEYIKTKSSSIKGLKVYACPVVLLENTVVKFYDLYSERWVLDKKIDSLFFDNQFVTSTTEYQYNHFNWLVNSEKTYNSRNETIERRINYPNNFSTIEPYASMVSQNILSPAIEQSEYKNNSFLQKKITDYKNWGNGIFVPEFVKLQTSGQSAPRTRITYHNYDSQGNPIYISKDDADQIIYLWGYNYQYPVAEIRNIMYEQIRSALGDDLINRVAQADTPSSADLSTISATLRALPNAQVTTYTYKPLVGIETVTDSRGVISYYVYDSLGRLKETYYYEENDPNKKRVIETHDYHYRN